MADEGGRPSRDRWASVARIGRVAVVLASLGFIGERLSHLDYSELCAAFSPALVAAVVASILLVGLTNQALAEGWASLAAYDNRLSSRSVCAIYGRGVLTKYIPGSVAQYFSRQWAGATAGLDHKRMVRASVVEMALHVIASLSVVVACFLIKDSPLPMVGALLVLLYLLLRSRQVVAKALGFQIVAFIGFATCAALVGWCIFPADVSILQFAALYIVAWLAGFLIPAAPGGIGVREAALLAIAAGMASSGALLVAAMCLRLASLVGDLAYGLAALLSDAERRVEKIDVFTKKA